MFTWLKTSAALTMLLAFAATSWGAEPAKSVLSANRTVGYDVPMPLASNTTAMAQNIATANCGENCGNDCGASCGHQGCGHHGCGHHCHNCDGYFHGHFNSRCNMIPHVAYINPMKSYYYFRPYQAFHVREQQNEVISYGGDPRQPYNNSMFRSIYPELEAAWAEEAAQHGSPFGDEVPQEGAPAPDEAKPVDPPAPEPSASSKPALPLRPRTQHSPGFEFEKPANNTAVLPAQTQGTFRARH